MQYLEEAKDTALNEVKLNAPRSSRDGEHFGDSFIAEAKGNELNKTYTIYSKTKFHLTHILEYGFVHYKSAKKIKGRPFISPAYEKSANELLTKIRKLL